MRIKTTTPKRPVNLLGKTFTNAKKAKQLHFKAAMMEAGERDCWNYWRSYRDVYQYEQQLGKIPFVIICLAMEHLDYVHPTTPKPIS